MKRHIIPCILSLTLLLTACGGEQAAADTAEEAVKDTTTRFWTPPVKSCTPSQTAGPWRRSTPSSTRPAARTRPRECGGRPSLHLCLLAGDTLHAGEDPDTEREYLEVFRTQVRQGSNAVTTEVLSDTLEGVGSFVGVEGLGGLLTFTAEVPRETADALRDPAQFAGA